MPLNTLKLLNLLGFILVIALNTLANVLPINGITTGELSALYPNEFVPAGFTFSIWGIIYLSLLVLIIFQFLKRANPVIQALGWWFIVSCLANSSWILAWHYYLPGVALIIMIILLFSLIKGYLSTTAFEWRTNWPVKLSFSLYLGWISVATIANATAVLVDLGWDGTPLSGSAWAAIMVGIAALFGVFFSARFKDYIYNGVILWAFWGIQVAHRENTALQNTLITAVIVIGVSTIFSIIKQYRGRRVA